MTRTLFWNVDTQYDFMRSDESYAGKLPVPGARDIEHNLARLTDIAATNDLRVINTADWHTKDSREIKAGEFPEHCMQGTKGAEYVPATAPENPYTIAWNDDTFAAHKALQHRNIVLYKDEFDVFHPTGGPHTKAVLDLINPHQVFVYGVATNVCVNDAVLGLLKYAKDRNKTIDVYVVKDAIAALPDGIPGVKTKDQAYNDWTAAGARFTTTSELEKLL